MKNIFKMLLLFLVGVLMVSASYPISQTEWADNIRVQVQKVRQERRRMRERQQKSTQNTFFHSDFELPHCKTITLYNRIF